MEPRSSGDARVLQAEDYVRFNEWLWITRLRSIAGIILIVALLSWVSVPPALEAGPMLGICAVYLVGSLAYRAWLRTRRHLRALAYVQLSLDTVALGIGMLFVHESPLLFHFIFLLTVVPASMIATQCGVLIAGLATAAHFLLLGLGGTAPPLSVAGLLPPAIFFLAAGQSVFYARQLARKNEDLAAIAASLHESNERLEEEAAVSSALLHTAQEITSSLDPQEIRQRLTAAARDALQCDLGISLLRDERNAVYRVAAVSGADAEVADEIRAYEFPPESSAAFERIAHWGVVPLLPPDESIFPLALMRRWGLNAFLCADLRCAGTSVGLLAVGFAQRSTPFSPREMRLASSIAQQAALALDHARLVEGLRDANRLKSEFIGTMSHELRSPLNVVMGYVDLLLDGEMGPLGSEQRSALVRVQHHSVQLLELIEETLDINRLDAGRLPVDLATFALEDFVAELRESVPSDWYKPDVSLHWEVGPAPLHLRTDRAKLKKVLRNLVHNALKFTENGSVTVTASERDGWIELTVSDTGIGISADALPFIFEMFRQVDGSPTRRHGGVGLGLYIVRQLVRGLGGDVTVSSTLNQGSTFTIRLPRGLDALVAAEPAVADA